MTIGALSACVIPNKEEVDVEGEWAIYIRSAIVLAPVLNAEKI